MARDPGKLSDRPWSGGVEIAAADALDGTGVRRSHQLHAPRPDHPAPDLSQERIRRKPVPGGLINEYQRAA